MCTSKISSADPRTPLGKQILNAFHALQPSTGQQTSFQISSKIKDREVEVVIGSEWNRKGFAAYCPFSLKGFDLPRPWETTDKVSGRGYLELPIIEVPPWAREPTSAFWRNAFDENFNPIKITADSPSTVLSEFWKKATESLFDIGIDRKHWMTSYPRLHAPMESDWFRLPNTQQLLWSTSPEVHEEFYHVL